MQKTLTIWCNAAFPDAETAALREGAAPHRLLFAPAGEQVRFAATGGNDPQLAEADVAFGQPDAEPIIASPRLVWVHINSAGYTPYDRDDLRQALRERGGALTKSSLVYDEPCAQHLMALLCGHARQLPDALDNQRQQRAWPQAALRARSRLLGGHRLVIVGYGTIGRRLVELLAPLHMEVVALRRNPRGDEPVPTFRLDDERARRALGLAEHVVNVLPAAPGTRHFFDEARLGALAPGAVFYNIGRGTTVDQAALEAHLQSGHLGAAYLDVTDPEPLPPEHPLWRAPRCHITPHTAGGHSDEAARLVAHFLENLDRFTGGRELLDRLI